ncbi:MULTISPECIES: YncE family protein [Bradyrhizobium]|uniref:YncE family protein n=1 Tax=Bradyrhizobium TaxID=374 RepID=UPI00067F1770|nr:MULTISPECIES: hypothetical protein [Bradyrhizobium]PAY04962.1 hypothetical protein CK489_30605 [Bradyrhizobium sp. UFLA03-84]
MNKKIAYGTLLVGAIVLVLFAHKIRTAANLLTETLLFSGQRTAMIINRLDAQEQTASKQEQIASKQEQAAGRQEQAVGRQEQAASRQEQAVGRQEQAAGRLEQTASRQEQIASKQEQTAGKQGEAANRLEQTASQLEETAKRLRADLGVAIDRQKRGRPAPDLQGNSIRVSLLKSEDGPMTPVSMTKISAREFLIANYRDVYLFDQDQRTAVPLEIDLELPVWNPTAVFYSAFYDRIFIANYAGGDIIVAQLEHTATGARLRVTERIADIGIKGAEGVAISRGGRFMGVADYDGNVVSMFERVDDKWVPRWKRDLLASHGITIIGEEVFASGQGSIVKLSIETGQELARIANIGTESIQFATCINEDESSGDLIGSDPMAGVVFTMTKGLQLKDIYGANGPTFANLSAPFCAYRDKDAAYVLSTYQDRIVAIGNAATTSFEFGLPRWKYIADQSRFRYPFVASHGSVRFDAPSYQMFDKTVRAAYGALAASDGTLLMMPGRGDLFGGEWPFYATGIASDPNWLVIVSNSSPNAILYNRKTGALGGVTIGEWDCWAQASEILCPSRRYSIGELSAAGGMLDQEEEAKMAGGWVGSAIPLLKYWAEWTPARPAKANH